MSALSPTAPGTLSPTASRVLPFAAFVLLMALGSAWDTLASALPALASVDQGWLYPVRTTVAALLLAWLWRSYVELRPATAAPAGEWGLAVLLGAAVFVLWITVGPLLRMSSDAAPATAPALWTEGGAAAAAWLAFRLAGTALVVPLIEELFWRSFLMRRVDRDDFLNLAPAKASLMAVLVSSAVFALEHRELAAGFLAGLAYAWIYRRRGDLRMAVLAHAVTNAMLAAYVLATGRWDFW